MEESIKETMNRLRSLIKGIADEVKSTRQHSVFQSEQLYADKNAEMQANIMLAYRHLEDARMRLGKVIQAHDGGVSCYDSSVDCGPA